MLLCLSCKSQHKKYNDLNDEQYEVLSALLNGIFQVEDHFYLNKYIQQTKYPEKFSEDYKRRVSIFKISDSLCKNSKDTLELKFRCPLAFNIRDQVGVFEKEDLDYFEEEFQYDSSVGFQLEITKLNSSLPLLSQHSENYYQNFWDKSKMTNNYSEESPSLQIMSIYFSKTKQAALISYKIINDTMENSMQTIIMKKENGIWWRTVG